MKALFFQSRVVWVILSCIGLVALLQLMILLHPTHVSRNLEPYPDGLLYALSARTFAAGNGLQLLYQDTAVAHWVPPLYTFTLSLVYFLWSDPVAFVLSNTLLLVATLLLLADTLWHSTKNRYAALFGVLAYCSHAVVLWLPSIPMSENLAVLLLVAGIWILTRQKLPPLLSISGGLSIAGALVFTRYAVVFPAAAVALLSVLKVYKQITRSHLLGGLAVAGVLAGSYVFLIANPLSLVQYVLDALVHGNNPYYSLAFMPHNLFVYLSSILGSEHAFLWLRTPLSSVFLSGTIVLFPVLAWKQRMFRWPAFVTTVSALSLLPLISIFYTADERYFVYIVPLIALNFGWCFVLLRKYFPLLRVLVLTTILLAAHVATQLPLLQQIIGSNVLGRAVAWQYQAITQITEQFEGQSQDPPLLVTALPPFLVGAYTDPAANSYVLFPLSPAQEFLAKEEWVWGSETDPRVVLASEPASELDATPPDLAQLETLTATIDRELAAGRAVYLTNAYITHLTQVVADYEQLQSQYTTELVAPGCDGSCDLYRIEGVRVEGDQDE